MIIDEELYNFLEHHGVKGMKWGQRKSMSLDSRSPRYQKRVAKQQKLLDRMRRVAAGNASRGDKFIVGAFRTTIANQVLGKGLQGGTARQLGQLQKEQDKINAGKRKTSDILKRSAGVNVRYLTYSH